MKRRSWKEFKGVAARVLPGEIRSSINPKGEITFDIETFRRMGEPQAMFLLYEESTRTIGLKAAHPDAANAVLVRVRHAKTNRVVRSAPFLKENGIEIANTLRFPYPALEDNILVLDLRTAVTCGKGGWKKPNRRAPGRPKLTDEERRKLRDEKASRQAQQKIERLNQRQQSLARARQYLRRPDDPTDDSPPIEAPHGTFRSGGF